MPFRFAGKRLALWPVTLKQMNADGSGMENGTFHVLLEPYSRAELKDRERNTLDTLIGRLKGLASKNAAPEEFEKLAVEVEAVDRKHEDDLVKRIRGWRDMVDPDTGEPVEFTHERLRALIDGADAYQAVSAAVLEASREVLAKNSQPGPAGS